MSILAICLIWGCKKDFLDKKAFSDKVIPTSLEDYQKILDADQYIKESPGIGEVSSDDYVITDLNFNAISTDFERNAYIWNKNIYTGTTSVLDWNNSYKAVFYANVVLDGLPKIKPEDNQQFWNQLKGAALFIRSFQFYNLAQVYSPIYGEDAAANIYGIPLRLNANVDETTKRSTVKQTYDQIINDLLVARDLLPLLFQATNRNRPSKVAVDALLSRVYLSMRDYEKAKFYADQSLKNYNKLINYNSLSSTTSIPFTRINDEVLYQSNLDAASIILLNLRTVSGYTVSPELYESYSANDLRKVIFYSAVRNFKGSYSERQRFNGLATDELFLIRAECSARLGNVSDAMNNLNFLLKTRFKNNPDGSSTYVDQTAINPEDALAKILMERRKELVTRGLRWSDLRRLNKEGYNITLTRTVKGVIYTLPPNDPRYVLPIPNDVVNLTGIAQYSR